MKKNEQNVYKRYSARTVYVSNCQPGVVESLLAVSKDRAMAMGTMLNTASFNSNCEHNMEHTLNDIMCFNIVTPKRSQAQVVQGKGRFNATTNELPQVLTQHVVITEHVIVRSALLIMT